MRQIQPYALWLGHEGDARDLRHLLSMGLTALVDLALNEPPATLTRELTYCRFPLLDGTGNPGWLIRLAVETTAALVRAQVPTLVFCSNGMSRAPVVVAAALAQVTRQTLDESLVTLAHGGPSDISPGLWEEVVASLTA
jgi:hypothetical protein